MSGIFTPSLDNLLPLIFQFLLRWSPATLVPLWKNRGGGEGKMVIELHIKVLRVWNVQGQHWVPIRITTKKNPLSVPPASLMLLLSLSPPSFPSLKSTTQSCLSLVFCWRWVKCARHISGWGNIMSGCSSTLCPPSNPILLISNSTFVTWWQKVFVGWDQIVSVYFFIILQWFNNVGNVLNYCNCSSKRHKKNRYAFSAALSVEESLASCTALFLCLVWLVSLCLTEKIFQLTATVSVPFRDKQMDTRDGMKGIQ